MGKAWNEPAEEHPLHEAIARTIANNSGSADHKARLIAKKIDKYIEQLIEEALPAPSTALDGNEAQTFISATENYRTNLKKVIR